MVRNVLKQVLEFCRLGRHYFKLNTGWSLLYRTAYNVSGYAQNRAPNFGNKVGITHFNELLQRGKMRNGKAVTAVSLRQVVA